MIGRPSIFHPGGLPGVDVLIGAGFGETKEKDAPQGKNFVPGNRYLTDEDLAAIDIANGGKYRVTLRTSGENGVNLLRSAAKQAAKNQERLFGYFGVSKGHLPFRTADGDFAPVESIGNLDAAKAEVYSPEDLEENVTLADMALAATQVLQSRSEKWWLMVEAGDVDWANHSNNIDNSIGAVLSGDAAFQAVSKWIESHGGWDDTLLILTADHGHYLVLNRPEALIPAVPITK
jgi:alkaline phosphatase